MAMHGRVGMEGSGGMDVGLVDIDFGCSDDKFSHEGLLASDSRVRQDQLTGWYCVITWEIGEWCEAGGRIWGGV